MNHKNLKHIVAISMSLLICSIRIIDGQTTQKKIQVDKLNERVAISTDREIYCTGETIFFKAFDISDEILRSPGWSKVLYVEVITPEGKPVFQGKYKYNRPTQKLKGSQPFHPRGTTVCHPPWKA